MRLILPILTAMVLLLGAPLGLVEAAKAQNYDPNVLQEEACLTTIRLENCLPYHSRACSQGFALACRVYQIGANCNGGNPNLCNYYVEILQANRACALDGNQQACAWLQAQNL